MFSHPLHVRVGEHIPKWLEKEMNSDKSIDTGGRRPISSIDKHLIDMKTAFKIIYTNGQGRLLKYTEALAIRKFKSPLCVQKQFIISLNLPC